jgi:hypothetical protein
MTYRCHAAQVVVHVFNFFQMTHIIVFAKYVLWYFYFEFWFRQNINNTGKCKSVLPMSWFTVSLKTIAFKTKMLQQLNFYSKYFMLKYFFKVMSNCSYNQTDLCLKLFVRIQLRNISYPFPWEIVDSCDLSDERRFHWKRFQYFDFRWTMVS